ncbi:glutamyl-tRNA synthetase [Candidatus Desulfarcum epimagneticum]|uniref:Glutamine--tRNA ligase n=1 Tax=uncultured Desulfobacteraceae bacterium TaxID=218296 RepID=A0A484HKY5_9BACT|nr:glutamyl-tRNA synthetase [uncultured Desulfobacteraceae bacterium]
MTDSSSPSKKRDFIRDIVEADMARGVFPATRFPPEPNGCLHIGHAKSICLNFGIAMENPGGRCNLRFDDTNPAAEDTEFVESIKEDVRWLGYDWEDRLFFASDYFERLFEFARDLIRKEKAYVCDLSDEDTRAYRGTLTEPGRNSPFRDRTVEENLDLFEKMRQGRFEDGARSLRAKIDMASPNLNMRDPVIYRIRKMAHHRTGDRWPIYPMYDFAHCLSDYIEEITHSLCTLEFEDHRPLYDWFLQELDLSPRPRQIEFARLNISRTVLSKRRLSLLVEKGIVDGWDDPRMPTLAGMRRRGYPPEAIRDFCGRIGVAKRDSVVDAELLEHCVRQDLNDRAKRVMGVLNPVRVTLVNYPHDQIEYLDCPSHPEDESMGSRKVPFSRNFYIERDDFMEEAPKKFFRLSPGREVRLRYAYYITCEDVVKDPSTGEIKEIRCVYDPETRGGWSKDGRKVRGTLHWVCADRFCPAPVRLYDRLFDVRDPGAEKDLEARVSPESLKILESCPVEESLGRARPGDFLQFERVGYFVADPEDSKEGRPVFNRTVTLRDSWAKMVKNKKK